MNRVAPIADLALHLGRGVQRIATDAVVGRVRSLHAGMGGMQAENIAPEGLRRGVAALDDLDTVSLLEKSV
jgi:hypothetical protein